MVRRRRRLIPPKEASQQPPESEQPTHDRAQGLRPPRYLEDRTNVVHGTRRPSPRKGHSPDIVHGHIGKEAVSTKGEAAVPPDCGSRPRAYASSSCLPPNRFADELPTTPY